MLWVLPIKRVFLLVCDEFCKYVVSTAPTESVFVDLLRVLLSCSEYCSLREYFC